MMHTVAAQFCNPARIVNGNCYEENQTRKLQTGSKDDAAAQFCHPVRVVNG